MRCPRHDLAAGPDGRCALCHREGHARNAALVRHNDRRIHKGLRLFIAVLACAATFATLMAWLDTSKPTHEHAAEPSR